MPPPALTEDEVLGRFNDEQFDRLAKLSQVPAGYDQQHFRGAILASAAQYLRDKVELSPYMQRKQVEKIARLIDRSERDETAFERLADEIEALDPSIRYLWTSRQLQVARCGMPAWRIPEPSELRDPTTRAPAASGLKKLITTGGRLVNKRWQPSLLAPRTPPGKRLARRHAERMLVMNLQVAVDIAGAPVAVTAHHDKAGPFARMAAEVLVLVGATGRATAAGLAVQCINDLQSERRKG
jgi:hypothetical protein